METIRTRQLEAEVYHYRQVLKRIAECVDAPDIDPSGDIQLGLHCGVEDRCLGTVYEGANFGYAEGVERTLEWASNEAKFGLEYGNK